MYIYIYVYVYKKEGKARRGRRKEIYIDRRESTEGKEK
jgi:hypothetical protein